MTIPIVKSRNSPYCFINSSLNQRTAEILDKSLSFYPEGYERCDKYISGEWDGRECLFKRIQNGAYRFPWGMIDTVRTVIEATGDTVTVSGIEEIDSLNDPRVQGFKWGSDISLRDYQSDALKSVLSSLLGGGVISLPTGAGKTILALKYIQYRDLPFLILVHRKELLWQWKEEVEKHLGIVPGVIGDGVYEHSNNANIAMIQTLSKKQNLIPRHNVLVVDECHVVPADTAFKVCMNSPARYVLGLSATPKREDGAEMKIWSACGPLVSNISVADLVDRGYLAKPEFRFVRLTPVKVPRSQEWSEIYESGIVKNNERNDAIIKIATKLAKSGRQIYIHVSHIVHGKYIESHVKNHIQETLFVSGTTASKKRKKAIQDFKDGKIRVFVSTLLKEGVDIPSMDALIYAAGHKSSAMVIQTIGRALRKKEGKENAIIVDFVDSGNHLLSRHADKRIETYTETYGKYCRMNIVDPKNL